MTDPTIREAAAADLPGIAAILNREIVETTATWTAEPRTLAEMAHWLETRRGRGRAALVAARGAEIAGYAALGPFRSGEGYARTAETSVYVATAARGRGLGAALLCALIERARRDGLHRLVAGVGADNAASLALHLKLGFEQAGRLSEVGEKFGRPLDLVLMLFRVES